MDCGVIVQLVGFCCEEGNECSQIPDIWGVHHIPGQTASEIRPKESLILHVLRDFRMFYTVSVDYCTVAGLAACAKSNPGHSNQCHVIKSVSYQTGFKSSLCQIKPASNQCWVRSSLGQIKPASNQCWISSSLGQIKPASNQCWVRSSLGQIKPASNQCWVK